MVVPVFEDFMYPTLEILGNGKIYTKTDVYEEIIQKFNFSDDDLNETTRSGKTTKIEDRIYWSLSYLYHTPLITRVSRGKYQITEEGLKLLNDDNVNNINTDFLMQYQEFVDFKGGGNSSDDDSNEKHNYWAYSPGDKAKKWDLDFNKGIMAIGGSWNKLGDLNDYDNKKLDDEIGNKIKQIENKQNFPRKAVNSIIGFYKEIKEGDIIYAKKGQTTVIGIGIVGSDSKYSYNPKIENEGDDSYCHLRNNITWKKLNPELDLKENSFLQDTLYKIEDEHLLDELNGIEPININEKLLKNRNLIYFGAPGTGKSFVLNQDKEKHFSKENNYTRVTFHPDYSYANFVGVYKPVPSINEEGKETISYEYVPGPFMTTLVKALDESKENFLLIIEEINRANVAAVFGDVFQLLDRKKDNSSRYPIDTSIDMKKYLEKELGKSYDKISIPSNMYIWATMNSADQGVFPMDTAFKRRWNFKYFSINKYEEEIKNIKFTLKGVDISWNDLRKAINKELLSDEYKINEDKLLGPFFAFDEYKDSEITEEDIDDISDIFKNKIIMYLFEDAARSKRNELFSGVPVEGNLTYSQVCDAFDKIGVGIFCDNIKSKFINEDGE